MSRKFLGLDVRHDSVSAVLVVSSLRETQIESFMRVPIPVADEGETGRMGLSSALEAIQAGMDVDQAFCIASIPADEISFRNLKVPFKGAKKIEQVLPFELEPTLPFPLENLVIDFQAIQPAGQGGQTDLIAVAALKSTIAAYIDSFAAVGIDPHVITPGGYATALCLNRFKDMPDNWVLVDIAPNRDTLFFISSKEMHLIRSFPSFRSGNGHNGIASKIQQTLVAFENLSTQPLAPEKAFLTGQGLNGKGEAFKKDMENALEIPVLHTDLVRHAGGKIKIPDAQNWQSDELDNALALIIAQIDGSNPLNFRKGPFAARRNWAVYKSNLIRLGVFALILLVLLGVNVFVDIHTLNQRAERMDRQITSIFRSTFPEIQKVVDPVHQMTIAMDELRSETFVPGDSNAHILILNILDEISKNIPGDIDVEFTRMVINQEDILISGNTDTFNSVDDIQTRLEKIPMFKKVTINSTNKDQNENRVRFKMKVDLL